MHLAAPDTKQETKDKKIFLLQLLHPAYYADKYLKLETVKCYCSLLLLPKV